MFVRVCVVTELNVFVAPSPHLRRPKKQKVAETIDFVPKLAVTAKTWLICRRDAAKTATDAEGKGGVGSEVRSTVCGLFCLLYLCCLPR